MADCVCCKRFVYCSADKVTLANIKGGSCIEYEPIFPETKKPVCKWCGEPVTSGKLRDVCVNCQSKQAVLPHFAKARDDLRELLGLERMGTDG